MFPESVCNLVLFYGDDQESDYLVRLMDHLMEQYCGDEIIHHKIYAKNKSEFRVIHNQKTHKLKKPYTIKTIKRQLFDLLH